MTGHLFSNCAVGYRGSVDQWNRAQWSTSEYGSWRGAI